MDPHADPSSAPQGDPSEPARLPYPKLSARGRAATLALPDSSSRKGLDVRAIWAIPKEDLKEADPAMINHVLSLACMRHESAEAAIAMIDHVGCDPNALYDYSLGQEPTRPLCLALKSGRWATAQALLERGADIDAKDGRGVIPLACAAQGMRHPEGKQEPCPRDLLDKLATAPALAWRWTGHPEADGSSVAHIFGSQPGMPAWLRGLGADLGARDDAGQTPLMIAALEGSWAACVELLAEGADPAAKNNHDCHALHYVCEAHRITPFAGHAAWNPPPPEEQRDLSILLGTFLAAGLSMEDVGDVRVRGSEGARRMGVFALRVSLSDAALADSHVKSVSPRDLLRFEGNDRNIAALERLEMLSCMAAHAPTARSKPRGL